MSFDLRGQVVAIVANGPSGTGHGSEIDACNFVVRMNAWITEGPLNAGRKVSALCGFCDGNHISSKGLTNGLEIPDWLKKRRDWELWCPIAAEGFLAAPTIENVGDWKWLLTNADGRPMRLIGLSTVTKTANYMKKMGAQFKFLSLGMACFSLTMALQPKRLHIWGYDATKFGLPTYDWAQRKLTWVSAWHDFVTEKILIAEIVDKGTWLGEATTTKLVWHGRPKECPVLPRRTGA